VRPADRLFGGFAPAAAGVLRPRQERPEGPPACGHDRPNRSSICREIVAEVPFTALSFKWGSTSRLQKQIEAVKQLPNTKQQFVSQMLDTVLAYSSR
jgi:hypothetical protein